ncbi:hypothetical protein NM688_g5739 [Phlebia brevispora]|uniref:Uncharacterized protein n=1 Tax=Phlebia brevispora TaxID=194682 RepID=A0ACC1SR27_9APHY|nr:hypothetical protein NM688_g5739 [Phlebia brevispora]
MLAAEEDPIPALNEWGNNLVQGRSQRSQTFYDHLRHDMKNEERRAHILTISWALFIVFWTVGSAIFKATEGWTYGDALYFCVVAFTTTGYGDFAPESPAGRSIFVVWALLGVATMTILVSVIEEAGSSRYKQALHSKSFDNAVKKYRKRETEITNQLASQIKPHPQRMHSDSSIDAAIQAAQVSVQRELESLPNQVIHHTRTFFDHMRYFVNKSGQSLAIMEGTPEPKNRIPVELKDLLDEIAQLADIGERAKRELLEDTYSRNTLLMLSMERTLRTLINSAERALAALAERDDLLEANQTRLRPRSPRPQSPQSQTPRAQTPRTQTPRTQTPRAQTPRPQSSRTQTPRPQGNGDIQRRDFAAEQQ